MARPVDSIRRDGVLYISVPGLTQWLAEYADRLRARPLDERSEDDGEVVLELLVQEFLAMELTYGGDHEPPDS